MKKRAVLVMALVVPLATVQAASADVFGTGGNQFTIDFVTILGDTNPASGYGIINNDYRMGVCEITNDQWNKFKAELDVPVTGSPWFAYHRDPYWTDTSVPTNEVSWDEAAQFVNWLNTSTGHQAAYKFTGTQGTGDYTFGVWDTSDAAGGTNLYRHKNAFYYLPTEDEWVKAAYWDGTAMQTYATKAGELLYQGDGNSGTGWNYENATAPYGPWNVGSGSEELNGTFDMMGNLWEWMESPFNHGDYGTGSYRSLRAGSYNSSIDILAFSARYPGDPYPDPEVSNSGVGFRVASTVPEPCSIALLTLGGLMWTKRRR